MRLTKSQDGLEFEEEEFKREVDIYSDDFDEEEAIDHGMSPYEAAFLRGFRRFN
ncbi:MAG: hypothetical protein V1729_01050 [Candidatus Woesearchaeota archaeon]